MTAPNNMVALLGGDDYVETIPSTSVVNGRLRYIVLDVDKPGKYFFNLQSIYNATVGEQNKILPIQFRRSGEPIPLNNTQISMDGTYPDGTGFHVVSEELDSNSAVTQFTLLDGLFQEVGDYVFTFTIKNTTTGAKETSRPCFFSVSQNINSLAIDWNNGVNPYDSEYSKWKAQVEAQINQMQTSLNNFSDQVTNFKSLVNSYTSTVNDAVNSAWNNKLSGNNTFTGTNTFNGNVTGTSINGTDLLLNGKSLKFTKNGTVTLTGLASGDRGSELRYWINANTLYIEGWLDSPKKMYQTFKGYIPTSISQRLINGKPYYIGVNDYDFSNSDSGTNASEFVLYADSGLLQVAGTGGDWGCRMSWVLPLKDEA